MSDLETINHDLHFIYLVVRTLVILFLVTALAPLVVFGLYICCLILEFLLKFVFNSLIITAFTLIGMGLYYRVTAKRIFQFENNN